MSSKRCITKVRTSRIKFDEAPFWKDTDSEYFPEDAGIPRVNTCGGVLCCGKGKQDSLDLGLRIEELLQNREFPVKLYVSVCGCQSRCSVSCFKDIGVVGLDGGWDLFVGSGSGEIMPARKLASEIFSEKVLKAVNMIADFYSPKYNGKNTLADSIESIGFENFREEVLREN